MAHRVSQRIKREECFKSSINYLIGLLDIFILFVNDETLLDMVQLFITETVCAPDVVKGITLSTFYTAVDFAMRVD